MNRYVPLAAHRPGPGRPPARALLAPEPRTAPFTLPIPAATRPSRWALVRRGLLVAVLTIAALLTLAAWIAPIVAAVP